MLSLEMQFSSSPIPALCRLSTPSNLISCLLPTFLILPGLLACSLLPPRAVFLSPCPARLLLKHWNFCILYPHLKKEVGRRSCTIPPLPPIEGNVTLRSFHGTPPPSLFSVCVLCFFQRLKMQQFPPPHNSTAYKIVLTSQCSLLLKKKDAGSLKKPSLKLK